MLAFALFCFCVSVWAQSDRGTLTGRVTDASGAAMSRATVVATEVASGVKYQASTTNTGDYTITSLPAGTYDLTVTADGFKKYLQKGITIDVAQTATLNIALRVGATTETVTVTADVPLLHTEDAEQSTTISRSTLNDLPINYGASNGIRDSLAFFKLTPGSNDLGPYPGYFKIDGLPVATEKVEVDGQDATGPNVIDQDEGALRPSVDAVQEFTLETSNFNPEFSQVSGGLFNFTSRSGTNQIHGSAYENWINEDLNAGTPFQGKAFQPERLHDRQNDYGFNVGGPVYIPHVYNGRNKTFFFFNFEQYRQNVASTTNITVPTAAMRSGDFSGILTGKVLGTDCLGRPIMENAIYDPATARPGCGGIVTDPFPGNIIPTNRLDAAAVKIQALFPNPTGGGLTNNLVYHPSFPITTTVPSFRIDQVLTDKWKMSFYMSRFSSKTFYTNDGLPNPITTDRVGAPHAYTYRLNSDYTISPTLFLHAGVGWLKTTGSDAGVNANYDPAQVGMPFVDSLGFPEIGFASSLYGGFKNGNSNGPFDIGTRAQSHWKPGKFTAVGDLTWVHGSHTYKAGGEFKDDIWDLQVNQYTMGNYQISGGETALPYLGTTNVNNTGLQIGFPYASFLLGQVDSGTVSNTIRNEWRRPYEGLYAQDTWKVNSKFTLTYGLRWEYTSPLHEIQNRVSEFSSTIANPNAGGLPGALEYAGSGAGQCNCNFMKGYKYGFGPRIGGAYQITPKTVLRAGWGFVYGAPTFIDYIGTHSVGVGFNILNFGAPGFGTANTTLDNGFNFTIPQLNAASHDPGIGVTAGTISNAPSPLYDPRGARPSRISNWTVSLQREITRSMSAEVAYVGNRGVWETSGDYGNLSIDQPNAISLQRLRSFGLDPTNPTDIALLQSTFDSGMPQAAGFNVPYAGFPTGQTLAQALRPFPQFNNIYTQFSPLGNSWYDALQAKLTNRFSHGLELLTSFTWSKSENLAQDYRGRYAPINDPFNRAANKILSPEDQPFIISVAFTYKIPTPVALHANRFSNALFGGWQVGGIERVASGFPITVPCSNNNLYSETFASDDYCGGSTFVNRVKGVSPFLLNPNSHFNPLTAVFLNPAAWADVPAGTYSTSALAYGDYRWRRPHDEEANLAKNFAFGERVNLQIRAEFFNLFNRRSYLYSPLNSYNAAQPPSPNLGGFGQLYSAQSVDPPRTGQLVARFSF